MARFQGLLITSIVFLVSAVLFYLLSVGGILFGGASRPLDLGVYSVTITLLMLGIATWLLRMARLRNTPPRA